MISIKDPFFSNKIKMELQPKSCFLVVSSLVFVFMVLRTLIRKPKIRGPMTPNLPPGPWKLPLIGNMHQLFGFLPHHRLRDLAQTYGPVMSVQLGEVHSVIISSPEVAEHVVRTHDINFANRPYILAMDVVFYNSTGMGGSPYGDYWRQLRKICASNILSPKRVQSFRSIREEEVSELVRCISRTAESPVNISEMVSSLTYRIISRVAFGQIRKEEHEFIAFVEELMKIAGGFSIADVFPSCKLLHKITGMRPRLERLHRKVDGLFDSIIDEHKVRQQELETAVKCEEKVDDFVDVLLKVRDSLDFQIPLTLVNIKALILDVFIGGSDTTSTVVEWTFSEMLKHPRVMEKAQEEVRKVFGTNGRVEEAGIGELNYLRLVIKETLRLHPPLPLLLPRENVEGCEINGYSIPRKTTLFVNAWAIGRDPKYWPEADKFFPERFLDNNVDYKGVDFELIPFGAGRRICPGMSFGILNVELTLANLLYHFDWKLPGGLKPESLDMKEEFGAIVKRRDALSLIPVLQHPLSDA